MCRCTFTSRVFQGGDSVADMQTQLRVVFRKVLNCGQQYLETKPLNTTFGRMWQWARNAQSEEQRRTWKAMRQFQEYRTKVEHDLLLAEGGQAILARVWDAYGVKVSLIYPERARGGSKMRMSPLQTWLAKHGLLLPRSRTPAGATTYESEID